MVNEWTIAVGALFMICFWGCFWYCHKREERKFLRKQNDPTQRTVIHNDARQISVEHHTVSYSVSGLGGHSGADGGGADCCG